MGKTSRMVAAIVAIGGGVVFAAQAPAPSLRTDVQPIFDRECTGCHGVKRARSKLDLSAANANKALVNAASAEVPSMMRVAPGTPEQSYLWLKLDGRASQGKGMPRGVFSWKRLSDADLAVIKSWIESGAAE